MEEGAVSDPPWPSVIRAAALGRSGQTGLASVRATNRAWHARRAARARARRTGPTADDLWQAVGRRDVNRVREMLASPSAPVNARGPGGVTLLMLAAALNAPTIVEVLLDAGAETRLESDAGNDAAEYAYSSGLSSHPVAQRLIGSEYRRS